MTHSKQRGLALVIVLLLIVLMSGLAINVAMDSKENLSQIGNQYHSVQTNAVAEMALEKALSTIQGPIDDYKQQNKQMIVLPPAKENEIDKQIQDEKKGFIGDIELGADSNLTASIEITYMGKSAQGTSLASGYSLDGGTFFDYKFLATGGYRKDGDQDEMRDDAISQIEMESSIFIPNTDN